MPAIWNSYSKSETARRPRMMIAGAVRHGEMHQQRVERLDLDALRRAVVAVGDLVPHDLDPLVGREQRPLAVVARDADDQPVDHLVARRMMSVWPLVIGSKVPG